MSGEADYHARRVDQMLITAKTKADLVHLVRAPDARNMLLQHIRDELTREINRERGAHD